MLMLLLGQNHNMPNFDVSTPIGSDNRGQGASNIRELKTAIQASLRGNTSDGSEAVFPGSNPSTSPIFRVRGRKGLQSSIPSALDGGLYFSTDTSSLKRSDGTTYTNIATAIPAGTVMSFYQSTSPIGWTAVSKDNKFLRVVTNSTTGGSDGGSYPADGTLDHTHGYNAHVHSYPHSHDLDHANDTNSEDYQVLSSRANGDYMSRNTGSTIAWNMINRTRYFILDDVLPALTLPIQVTGSASLGVVASADIILASKD